MRIFAALLLLSFFALGACSKFSKVQKSKDYEYKLKMADQYYEAKKYHYAQQLYEELFPVFRGTERFENLYYKYAFCAYYLKDYLSAENLFKSFVEVFPNSKKSEEMDYMRAYTYYKQSPKLELDQTNTAKAIGFMQTFINTHPGSARNKEAAEIIDKCHAKMELKEERNAALYYNVGQYRAAAVAYTNLMNEFPDSEKSDQYKILVIKSYFQFAEMSVDTKKEERFEKVLAECNDFIDRFPESKYLKDAEKYLNLSTNNIKTLKNEQVKKTT
jgi:outer membrane protein assembly factor BamD